MRFVGDPERRIREDVLRVLRFFRFTAGFGSLPGDPASLEAAVRLAPLMADLSGERLRAEVLGILAAPDPVPVVSLMAARGVFRPILPAAETTARLARTVAAEARLGCGPDPLRRLAALLDRPDPGRLRLSAAETERLRALAEPKPLDRETLYREGRARFLDRLLLAGGNEAGEALLAEPPPPPFPLSGRDLLDRGIPAGPEVGRLAPRNRGLVDRPSLPPRPRRLPRRTGTALGVTGGRVGSGASSVTAPFDRTPFYRGMK